MTEMAIDSHAEHKSTFKKLIPWAMIFIGMVFYCYAYFLRVSPSVMMPDLMRHFHIDAAMFGNLTAFYYYAYDPMQLPVGLLIDRYGTRLVLFMSCFLASVGLFMFIIANHYGFALAGRFLVGFGSAFAYISVLKLATVWLPQNRFAIVAGLTTSLGMVAAMFSDKFLTSFVASLGYKQALTSAFIFGAILSVIILVFVRNKPKDNNSESQNQASETSTVKEVLSSLMVMFKNPQMWLIGFIGCLLYMPASVFLDVWGIPYLKSVYHLSAQEAATAASMVFLGWIVSSPLIGWLSDNMKRRKLPLQICALAAFIIISFVFYGHMFISQIDLYLLMFFFGAFCGCHPLTFSISKENNPHKFTGTASALTNTLIMLGGVIFQPVVGILLDLHYHGTVSQGIPVYSSSDYTFALSVLPIGLLICIVLTLFVRETHCRMPDEG